MNKKRLVIIGAGPAGLTAAYELLKRSDEYDVTILEATNDIGGISKTATYKDNRIDIGGHRFFTKSEEVNKIWNEIMPLQSKPSKDDIMLNREIPLNTNGRDPEQEDEVMLIRNRVSRILYLRKFFDYPISIKPRTFINMGFIKTMRAGFGYIGSAVHKRKEDSLENFYINRFGKPLYSMFFEKYTEKVWGRHPSEIDASWGAQRVKGLSLMKTFANALMKPFRKKNSKKVETSLIEQFSYPKKGPGQLYEVMAEKVVNMGAHLRMNEEVNKVNFENGRIVSVQTNSNTYLCDELISSMPIKDLSTAMGKENLSEKSYEIAQGLVYRDFITVGVLLNDINLKNKTKTKTVNNILPDTWIYVQEPDVKVGRLQIFNNWSPYMLKDFDKNIWMGLEYFANEGDELWEMDKDKFIEMAKEELVKIKVINKVEDVIDAVQIKIKKAYPAYFDTYKDINILIEELKKIPNLYCIGRNGQHRYNNMDHSMLTAIETINYILEPETHNKNDIYNVNTEKEYHEKKTN